MLHSEVQEWNGRYVRWREEMGVEEEMMGLR